MMECRLIAKQVLANFFAMTVMVMLVNNSDKGFA